MRFWHGMGYTPLDELTPLAQHAEALGFYGMTLGDHWVTAEEQVDRYEIAADGTTPWEQTVPWPDPWVQFAALSKDTTRLRFLTTVYILPLRDAFTAAKGISTASVISGGRIHLGLGVGWQKLEFGLSGQPFHKRGRHADEQIDVLKKLWTGEMVEHQGDFYSFPRIRMLPAPPSPIPIYVGGTSEAAFRRAARYDGWEGAVYPWNEIEAYVKGARAARLEEKGTLDGFRMIVGCTEPTPERMDQLREWGVTDYLKPPWTDGLNSTQTPLDYKLEEMARFSETYRVGASDRD
ncbi:MAG: TIGR03619 family F420-dependent LLM class oxidoreductase [bacterium]|nr:LLM class F420-dependent oxidoreductase [Deltaproteobacteria bacterium]MCP4906476.1 TIGR03619 family F420-dependent LLM class oxidoreductase [bacterium]